MRRRAAAVEEALDDAVSTLDGIADDPDSMAAAHRSVQRAMHQASARTPFTLRAPPRPPPPT